MNRHVRLAHCLYGTLCLLLTALFSQNILRAQAPVDYDDVALVINGNSSVSKEIGAYFAAKRPIPEKNIIRISVPEQETITDEQFQDLRSQIEKYLTDNALESKINYIVLTKGVPLRINRQDPNENALTTRKASVDNELPLILGQFTALIGDSAWATHNYGDIMAHFRRSLLPIFLVTRLDAYTKEDVFAMIDHSGPNTLVNKDSALFVLDQDPTPIDSAFHQSQLIAAQGLRGRGWWVTLNTDTVYVTGQRNVLGYASWGSNDDHSQMYSNHAIPHNTWSPGALAETFVSTSGRSFQPGTEYGQSLIADWLAEGVVGAKGYVFEPFTIALALPHILLDRYTDESQDTTYNLAESFYMASRTLSWMDVVLGDPKTSIMSEVPPAPTPLLPPTIDVCVNDNFVLRPNNISRGAHNWFDGDSATLVSLGLPYDNKHPRWIAGGRTYKVPTGTVGTKTYTYVNTNVSGNGLSQVTVVISEVPEPDFTSSADTVGVGEVVEFTDMSQGDGERYWSFGDGATSLDGELNPTHSYEEIGIYVVELTVVHGNCSRSITRTIVVRNTTGVADEAPTSGLSLNVLPNPTSDQITLSMEIGHPTEVTLKLYDPNGRLLREEHRFSPSSFRGTLSLKEYPSGIYLIEAIAGEKRVTASAVRQ